MSEFKGVLLPGTPSHPRVQRKLPAPFRRPSVNLDGPPEIKREWRNTLACNLAVGDTVPGIGVITSVDHNFHVSPRPPAPVAPDAVWTVTVEGGEGNRRVLAGNDAVMAFVPRGDK